MITFQNNTSLTNDQIESIKAQYMAWIEGYISAREISKVSIATVEIGGKKYAKLVTLAINGSTYNDHFEI